MRQAAAAIVLICASVGLCFAQSPSSIDKPEVKPGERWIYHRIDYRTNALVETYELRVAFVGKDVIHGVIKKHRIAGKPEDVRIGSVPALAGDKDGEIDAIWTSEWNTVSSGDGAVAQPHTGFFRFPLKVGAAYRTDYEFRRPREGARASKVRHNVRVVGWEEISVPAGKFRALKVEATGHYERLDIFERGSEQLVCWYVPEIKRSAKCVYQTSAMKRGEELVAFELR